MRKSVFIALVASSLVVLSGVTGRAGTLWDIDVFYKYLSGQTTSYSSSFDNGKHNRALETVTSAEAWFLVWDDQILDSNEEVAVKLGDRPFRGPSNANYNLFGGLISDDALLTLNTTGTLKYTFLREKGDFTAVSAALYVETRPRAVPDGGATLMLLGVALAGIVPLRRRMAGRTARMA